MPATEAEIFAVEAAFETAFQATLAAVCGGNGKVFKSREKRDAQTPYVELVFTVGQVTANKQHVFPDGMRWCFSAWVGSQLSCTVVTQRQNNGDMHAALLGAIRKECQMYRLVQTWPSVPCAMIHVPTDIRESGTTHTFDNESDLDQSTISFTVVHNIVDSAWPSDI